jgi:8-oxo-dGTP pyrophosphatase MutT (NUDIX family)
VEQPSSAPVEIRGSGPLWPVSVKGVLFVGGNIVLLKNERDEWELPGGRLEPGEEPGPCLAREISEELGIDVKIADLLDCWRYPVRPTREVLIVTFGVQPLPLAELRLSDEHKALGRFALTDIAGRAMPEGYRRSIRHWAQRLGFSGGCGL